MDKDTEIRLLRIRNADLRDDLRKANLFNFLFILAILVLFSIVALEAEAQVPPQDALRCTNGTLYIFIKPPGMCPPGWWPA